nr:hypothetical protein [Brevibacillus laterosporus]
MVTDQKAYMGSAPRYVTPDFLLGSLNAMSPIKKAELFYRYASPNGTNLLQGDMYFATIRHIAQSSCLIASQVNRKGYSLC